MAPTDAPQPEPPMRLAQQDEALLQHLWRHGLPLSDEPFAELGRGLGLGGDTVIERLRLLLGRGVIVCICPIFASAPPPHPHNVDEALDGALRAALVSGLPLVKRPFEAMGAMLGCSAERVRQRLADWLDSGRMLRIAALPPPRPQSRSQFAG